MKLKNSVMFESIQTLTETQETGKLGYACARNLRKLMDAAREYMVVRDEMLRKYGEDQGGGKYNLTPDAVKAFSDEIREYAEMEHEVDVMQVSEDVFCSGNLATKEMYALSWMVKEGE